LLLFAIVKFHFLSSLILLNASKQLALNIHIERLVAQRAT
jgi:hypothetical protein